MIFARHGVAFAARRVDVSNNDALSMSVNAPSKELGTTAALLRSRERLRSAVRRAAICSGVAALRRRRSRSLCAYSCAAVCSGVSVFRRNRDRLRFSMSTTHSMYTAYTMVCVLYERYTYIHTERLDL